MTDSLRRVIDEKHVFVKEKEDRINRIKCMLKSPGLTLEGEYRINLRLYNEYKKFHIDSAIHYVDRNIEISRQLNRPYFTNQSSLHLSLLYSMCGRFREAEIILKSIKTSELPRDLLINYYQTYSSFWGHYSISVANNLYGKQQAAYQDSLFALIDHTSWDYRMSQASYYIWRDTLKSKEIFKELLEIEEVGTPNYAMITHSYSRLCHHQKKYDEEKPDLVIMDITMPNMDGLQALKKIRESDTSAKIVMCTAMGQESMVVDAIKSGAKDFIVKPFNAERIVQTVNSILGK